MTIDAEFWHTRWRDGVTPWHQARPNRLLVGYFGLLGLAERAQVLVPLCGKAVDMRWLLERRHRVLGVELSEVAARAFFDDNGLRYEERREGRFLVLSGADVTILCGDVFDLESEHLSGVDAVYDRAALIALDAADRERYVAHLTQRLPEGVSQLLVTFEFDPARIDGPPFAVAPEEVRRRFGHRYAVRLLESAEVLHEQHNLRARGLDALTEHAFLLLDQRF
jgi:thiopurine S-methyltransferase